MSIKGLAICLTTSILALAAAGPAGAGNSNDRDHAKGHKQHSGDLVKVVREATWRYRDVNQAEADGYQLLFGCVSGPDDGAMGLHYVNIYMEIGRASCRERV